MIEFTRKKEKKENSDNYHSFKFNVTEEITHIAKSHESKADICEPKTDTEKKGIICLQ